jgi:hypothetical protein
MASRTEIPASEEFGILTATWILACNDKVPIITYRGVQRKLQLERYPIEAIKSLIESRGELFGKRVPSVYLESWKEQMLAGKQLPTWMLDEGEAEREQIINGLSLDDVFVSQFRANAEESSWTNGSPREVMDWGLQHIERIRRAGLDDTDAKLKRWQLWILVSVSVANFLIGVANVLVLAFFRK